MGYLLQYQSHVDDLTSLSGSPEDTSWFSVQPYESPRRRTVLNEGIFAGDLASLAGSPEDSSWFSIQPYESPRRRTVPEAGIFAADISSAGAVTLGDVSWFVGPPVEHPQAEKLLPTGFVTGDLYWADDVSWFSRQPHEQPEAERLLPTGLFAGDLVSAGAQPEDTSWFLVEPFTSTPPVRPSLHPEHEGFYAGDRESAAREPQDVSWFVSYPDEAPLAREVPPQGLFTADLSSIEGVIYVFLGDIVKYNAAGGGTPFYEATYRSITGEIFTHLFDLTASSVIFGSDMSRSSTVLGRERSGALVLIDGNEYRAQFGKQSANVGAVIGAKIIVT